MDDTDWLRGSRAWEISQAYVVFQGVCRFW